MLEANQIWKSYGNLQVLRGVDLKVEKGEMVSIVGASGAGKSTLLHILGTLDKADLGQMKLDNIELTQLTDSNLARFRNQKIGFIFQFHNLLPEFSALENVCIPGFISGYSEQALKKKAEGLLDNLGLQNRIYHKPSELSGGEQQRVAVARALINDPAIIFADEPSGNLDSKNANDLHDLFYQLKTNMGQTFVIVTHNKQLADMADRKLEMKDGVILT